MGASHLADRHVRARTRAGRLDATVRFLKHAAPDLLSAGTTVVDVGFGESPVTLTEWTDTLDGSIQVIGVERDEARAAAAAAALKDNPRFHVIHGGFEAVAQLATRVQVVRAMNVLRSYAAHEVPAIHEALGARLVNGGIVLEGSSDTEGHVTVAHLLRKHDGAPALQYEAMLFHTDFSRGFSPWLFRDWLPRDLRRDVRPGTAIHELLQRWHAAFETTTGTLSERFKASTAAMPELTWWADGGAYWRRST